MNIQRKLEEIRRKPEHIRLRYTYGAVAISMFFIILLWIFSLTDTIRKADTTKQQNVFENIDTQKKSLKDATTDIKKSLDDLNNSVPKTSPAPTQTSPQDDQILQKDPKTSTSDTPPVNSSNTLPDRNMPLPNNINNKTPLPKQ